MHDPASTVAWLESYGVTEHSFLNEFPLNMIDVRKSRENRARLAEPIDPDTVDRYVTLLKRGEEPPPLVIEDHGDGVFTIIHGNHRDESARRVKRRTLPVFVVTGLTDIQRDLLIYTSNARNPLGVSDADRIEQACSLVERKGMSPKEVAGELLIPVKRVNQRLAERRAEARLLKLMGAANVRRLAHTKQARLATIASDSILFQATQLVLDFRLSGDIASDLVTKINALDSEVEQLALIRRTRQAFEDASRTRAKHGGPRQPPIVRNLRFVLERALLLDPDEIMSVNSGNLTDEQREQLRDLCADAVDRLILVREVL